MIYSLPTKPAIYTALIALLVTVLIIPEASGAADEQPPIPDLTKPNMWRPTSPKMKDYYNLGPTGMMGLFMGPDRSSMIFVDRIEKGSPAEGKILRGDLLLGVNGVPFKKGDNLIVLIGNAIMEAEKEENKGKITFIVWRDKNWPKRTAELNVNEVSVDDILAEVKEEADALVDWKTEEQAKAFHKSQDFKKAYEEFPMDASTSEITLTLEVLGSYSDTAPFNCPKTDKIIEKAYPHIIAALKGTRARKGQGALAGWRSGTIGLALLATGNPEHEKIVIEELHKNLKVMSGEPVGNDGWGMSAWFSGYYLTFLGEYYLRTGDKAVLEGLRQQALAVAKNQAYGGTWGHSGHRRSQNFGKLHGPAPGYGAMNQAAGPCFYGLTLAQKAGINEPIVDEAVRRSTKFYATYVDKGCVPYGYHGPGLHEDSNGKNGPPALAMKMVGEEYMAKYYSLSCSVANTWGYRGGHGDGTFGNYWPQLASTISGPKAVAAWMKRALPWYTMLRRHNGSWVCVERGSAGGFGGLFNQTAMYMIQLNIPKAQLYMTGKKPNPKFFATDRDLMHLEDRVEGKWREFTTDQILDRMDTFSTELRRSTTKGYPSELIKRYKAGETDMVPKLVKMLDHNDHRAREGAFYTLCALDQKHAKAIQDKAIKALEDPSEIVRMAAVQTLRRANSEYADAEGGSKSKRLETVDLDNVINPLFAAALRKFENDTHDTYNTPYMLQQLMINSNNLFAKAPFDQGYDTEKVAKVLEEFLSQDPRSGIMSGPSKFWDRRTTVRMAGPVAFVAENFPMNGIMFGGSATTGGQSLLLRHKFVEGIECGVMESNKISRVLRGWRPRLQPTKMGWFAPKAIMANKGVGKNALPWMYRILVDRPNATVRYDVSRSKKAFLRMDDAIEMIEDTPQPEGWTSLREVAMKAFLVEVDAQGGMDAQIAYCRAALQPERKTYFRQLAAMDRLVELLGEDATADLGPYISHEHLRFQDHSRELIMKLKGTKVAKTLVELAASDQESIAAGALTMLGARGDKEGVDAGMKYITSHKSGLVRGAAAQAIYGGSNGEAAEKLLGFIKNAKDPLELEGYEGALLLRRSEPPKAKATSDAILKVISSCPVQVRRSLYYVLGQFGGKTNLNYLAGRVDTEDKTEFKDIIEAISLSRDISATNQLLKILENHQGTHRAFDISDLSLKRVINGAEELGKVPDDVNIEFATRHLKVVRSLGLLNYMGSIHQKENIDLLYKYMELGPKEVTAQSVKSIIRSAATYPLSAPEKDRKHISEVLAKVLEYINVVYTRQDIETLSTDAGREYAAWKIQGDNAGEAIKRIYNPRKQSLDADAGIDEDDLDL